MAQGYFYVLLLSNVTNDHKLRERRIQIADIVTWEYWHPDVLPLRP